MRDVIFDLHTFIISKDSSLSLNYQGRKSVFIFGGSVFNLPDRIPLRTGIPLPDGRFPMVFFRLFFIFSPWPIEGDNYFLVTLIIVRQVSLPK